MRVLHLKSSTKSLISLAVSFETSSKLVKFSHIFAIFMGSVTPIHYSVFSIFISHIYWVLKISIVRLFSNCNSNSVSLLICTRWIRSPLLCLFLRFFQLGEHSEEMRCNRYNYTYLTISPCLVVSLHQIIVSFAGFPLEYGSVRAARRWCVSARYHWYGVVRGRRTQD